MWLLEINKEYKTNTKQRRILRKAMEKTKTENSRKYEWVGCFYVHNLYDGSGPYLKIVEMADSRKELLSNMKGRGYYRIIKAEVVNSTK